MSISRYILAVIFVAALSFRGLAGGITLDTAPSDYVDPEYYYYDWGYYDTDNPDNNGWFYDRLDYDFDFTKGDYPPPGEAVDQYRDVIEEDYTGRYRERGGTPGQYPPPGPGYADPEDMDAAPFYRDRRYSGGYYPRRNGLDPEKRDFFYDYYDYDDWRDDWDVGRNADYSDFYPDAATEYDNMYRGRARPDPYKYLGRTPVEER